MATFWRGAQTPRPPSATRRLRQSERSFRQAVMTLAHLRHWLVYWTWTSIHSPAGMPDLILCRPPGPLWFVELKTDTGRLTAAQEQWLAALAQCPGVRVGIWRPSMWPEIEKVLE